MDELYNTEQVADYFHVRIETIRDWVKRGILHGFKAGRDYRYTKQNIEDATRELQAITERKRMTLEERIPGLTAVLEAEAPYWQGHEAEWIATKPWLLDFLESNPRITRLRWEPAHGILISMTDADASKETYVPELAVARR